MPTLTDVQGRLVLDYSTVESLPETRLSVFVKPSVDVGRASYLEVSHVDSGIVWTINNPYILNASGKNGAGSPFLMPPYYGQFPSGKYNVTYVDMAGYTAQINFTLQNLDEFTSCDSVEKLQQNLSALEVEKKTVIYTEKAGKGTILYFGDPKDDWTDSNKIAESYEKAYSYRDCLFVPTKGLLCLLPPIDVR
ncbi:MAG: hypothetical protein J6B81_02405 [Spirochaetaceae bacterium]|nr:hypothetical protein [Spirochaetaceae bacterium]